MKDLKPELCEIFFNASHDLMLYLDNSGTILNCNNAFCEFSKMKKEDIIGKKCYEIVHKLKTHENGCPLLKTINTFKREEMEMFAGDKVFRVTVDPIIDETNRITGFVHVATDITNYKTLIKKLQENEEKFRELFNRSNEGQLIMQKTFVDANDRMAEIFKCKKEDIIGKHPADFSPRFQPDGSSSLEKSNSLINMALSGVDQYFYWQHTDINGKPIDTNVHLKKIVLNGEDFLLATVRDISEELFYEKIKKALDEKINLLNRAESLQNITLGLLHDLNNVIMVILGCVDLLSHKTDVNNPVFIQMKTAIEKAKRFTDTLYKVTSGSKKEIVSHNLNTVVETTLNWIKPLKKEHIAVEKYLDNSIPPVMGNELSTQQIVMNLIINSIEAIGNRQGKIVVKTGVRDYSKEELQSNRVNTQLNAGKHIFFEIKDNGCGMSEEIQKKIFEPFFSTKFYGKGLGMISVKNAIESYNGGLLMESVEQKGTKFEVLFPICLDSAQREESAVIRENDSGLAKERRDFVLIADRDDLVRGIVVRHVSQMNLKPIEATQNEDIRNIFSQYSDRISAVIIDATGSDINIVDTVSFIKKTTKDVIVIITGTFIDQNILKNFYNQYNVRFLTKPYTFESIKEILK